MDMEKRHDKECAILWCQFVCCCDILGCSTKNTTSSGIIEAASFGKYVINLGDRQNGRAFGLNIIQTNIINDDIQAAILALKTNKMYSGYNIYYKLS